MSSLLQAASRWTESVDEKITCVNSMVFESLQCLVEFFSQFHCYGL